MEANGTSRNRIEHLWIMLLAVGAIAGSFILMPLGDRGLGLRFPGVSPPVSLPETCMSIRVLGTSCPGCGLTRSFVATARGEFRRAFLHNPMGPVLFVLCLVQIPYRILAYLNPPRFRGLLQKLASRTEAIIWVVLAGLMISWMARLLMEWSWLKLS